MKKTYITFFIVVMVLLIIILELARAIDSNANKIGQQDLLNKKAALDAIIEYTSKMCGEIPVTSSEIESSGKILADKLGLGLKGEGQLRQYFSYQLPKNEIAMSLEKSIECKIKVSSKLQEIFFEDIKTQEESREKQRQIDRQIDQDVRRKASENMESTGNAIAAFMFIIVIVIVVVIVLAVISIL
jgi:hypothetical protein